MLEYILNILFHIVIAWLYFKPDAVSSTNIHFLINNDYWESKSGYKEYLSTV